MKEVLFTLQRANGYFRAEEVGSAIHDLFTAYTMGNISAYFDIATAHFLCEGIDEDLSRAKILSLGL